MNMHIYTNVNEGTQHTHTQMHTHRDYLKRVCLGPCNGRDRQAHTTPHTYTPHTQTHRELLERVDVGKSDGKDRQVLCIAHTYTHHIVYTPPMHTHITYMHPHPTHTHTTYIQPPSHIIYTPHTHTPYPTHIHRPT